MQDNFNIYSWKLKQAINELEEKQCPDCGCKMEGQMCNECGYMEEAATFTDKHDDNPKLKGGQKDLPDELQAQLVKKEGEVGEDFNKNVEDFIAKHINIIKDAVKFYKNQDESYEDSLIQTIYNFFERYASKDWENLTMDWPDEKDEVFYNALKSVLSKKNIKEGSEDHEVSMAQNSLKAIISSASQLMAKLGDNERNIPGWIQDHIAKSENYIEQANQGFHELEPAVKDVSIDTLDMVAEGVSDEMKTKAKNALAIHLRSAMADKNQEHIDEIKDARDRINNAKSVDELANILGEFGYEDNEIEDILS